MSVARHIPPNLQRGFFTGRTHNASSVARTVAQNALAQPVSNVRQAKQLVFSMAEVLPSWSGAADALRREQLGVQIVEEGLDVDVGVDQSLRRPVLRFRRSHDRVAGEYFAPLQRALGFVNTQLADISSPPLVDGMDPRLGVRELSSGMWEQMAHHLLLVESSFLQSMLEAQHMGLELPGDAYPRDWMTAVDMAWYRCLRADGLAGMAAGAASLLSSDYVSALTGEVIHELRALQAHRALDGGRILLGTVWDGYETPQAEVPANCFDDWEAELRSDRALYRQAHIAPIAEPRATTLRAQWLAWLDRPVVAAEDIGRFPDFLQYAAPGLYADLHPHFSAPGWNVEVRDHFPQGAEWMAGATRLFEDGAATSPMAYTVERGTPVRGLIPNGAIDCMAAAHPFAQLVERLPGMSQADYMYERSKAFYALIATARLELLHGEQQRGLRTEPHSGFFSAHAIFLEAHGAKAFAARFDNMPDQLHLREMRAAFEEAV